MQNRWLMWWCIFERGAKILIVSCFQGHNNAGLLKTGSKQIWRVSWVSLALFVYAKKEEWVAGMVDFLAGDKNLPGPLISRSRLLQLILNTNANPSKILFHTIKAYYKVGFSRFGSFMLFGLSFCGQRGSIDCDIGLQVRHFDWILYPNAVPLLTLLYFEPSSNVFQSW